MDIDLYLTNNRCLETNIRYRQRIMMIKTNIRVKMLLGFKKLRLPAFLFLLLYQSILYSQVKAQLLEKGTRRPLANINIFILPEKLKTVTDNLGNFEFQTNPSSESEIIINQSGYKKWSKKMVDFNKNSLDVNIVNTIYLEKESYNYLETTVTGVREKKESQKTLSQEEFLTMPGSGGDPVKAVQNLPGVNRSSGGDARVVIQGGEPEDTHYNINGHDVPLIFHFGGLTSIVTPEAVDSVDYFSAGYGSEWGRSLGGHVGLNVRNPKEDRMHLFAFADSFNTGGLIEGPINDSSSFLFTGRYSYIGQVLKSVMKDSKDFNLTVAPSFYDISTLYHYKINPQDEFQLFAIASQDTLEFVLNKPIGNDPKLRGNFYQKTQFNRIIPKWERKVDENTFLKISSAYGSNNIMADISTNFFHLKNKSLSNRLEFKKTSSSNYRHTLGIDSMDDWYEVNLRLPSVFSSGGVSNPLASSELKETSIKGHDNLFGAFWVGTIKSDISSPFIYIPQLRWDYFSPTHENLIQPRLSVRYQYTDDLLFRFSSGLYYQLPQPQEYDSYYGNSDLKSSRAIHYLMGIEKDFREGSQYGWQLNSSLFYKKLSSLVIPSQKIIERNGVQSFENYSNEGKGHVKGFEFQLKFKDSEKMSWVGSYTFVQSRRQQPNQKELPSQFDQTHSFNLLASYEWENWNFGTRIRFVSGTPFTPIIGSAYDSDNDVYIPKRGEIFSSRNPNFFQLDFRADRKWIFDTWILSGYLDIQNLTNSQNREGITYSFDYSEKQSITGLPILPSIGIKGEF